MMTQMMEMMQKHSGQAAGSVRKVDMMQTPADPQQGTPRAGCP